MPGYMFRPGCPDRHFCPAARIVDFARVPGCILVPGCPYRGCCPATRIGAYPSIGWVAEVECSSPQNYGGVCPDTRYCPDARIGLGCGRVQMTVSSLLVLVGVPLMHMRQSVGTHLGYCPDPRIGSECICPDINLCPDARIDLPGYCPDSFHQPDFEVFLFRLLPCRGCAGLLD